MFDTFGFKVRSSAARAHLRARFSSASVPTTQRPPGHCQRRVFNTIFYVGGPVSVLNGACPSHANVRLDYYNPLALTMKPLREIAVGEELYIQYDDRPLDHMASVQECPMCSRLVTDV